MAEKAQAKKAKISGSRPAKSLDEIVSLTKRRGFIFQGSEIYGGLAGTWDYGPYGVLLKNNIRNLWWRHFVTERDDVFGLDSAILMNARVWEASGHTGAGFADPLVEDKETHLRYRADHLLEEAGVDNASELSPKEMDAKIKELKLKSPEGNPLTPVRVFNLMFQTQIGPVEESANQVYLRPETAQGMFVNFKNVIDSLHPRLPFGLAQIGKNFRNEITPKDFIFRVRELEIMEFEYFIREQDWKEQFEAMHQAMNAWFERVGFKGKMTEVEVPEADRAHYSKRTVDFYFDFPHRPDEVAGLAYRTDFDLSNHAKHSGADLTYLDPNSGEKFIPHVLEPTFGLDRHVLAVLSAAYTVEEVNGEERNVLKLKPELAPVKVAVSPLLRNKPELVKVAQGIYRTLKQDIGEVMYDDNGNIGKRYRRQDEIGTPLCVTVDFESLDDKAVTIRHRDTLEQVRVPISEITKEVRKHLTQF